MRVSAAEAVLRELLAPTQRAGLDSGQQVDFSFTWRKTARLRGNAFRAKGEAAIALRLICHVITIEDPIEAVVHPREEGDDTAQALDLIIDVFPSDRQAQIRVQLANALTGIVYQRLLPRVEGGLVAAYEVLVANSAVRNLVKEGKTNQIRNVVSTHQQDGMQTLEKALAQLVADGVVDLEEARLVSLYPREVEAPAVVPVQEAAGGSADAGRSAALSRAEVRVVRGCSSRVVVLVVV